MCIILIIKLFFYLYLCYAINLIFKNCKINFIKKGEKFKKII